MGPTIIDANIIIRFLAEDDLKKAEAVEQLFKKAGKNEYEIPDVIMAEIVWVLASFYGLGKSNIIEKLEGLLSLKNIKINRPILQKTIAIWRENNISYTDAYLCAYALEKGKGKVCSFDKGLDQVREISRQEP